MIRVDAVWLAVEPLDLRSGTESMLTRVVNVFGAARPHHAYLFTNRRANRLKVLVHDGIGVWLAARRLNAGRFVWGRESDATLSIAYSAEVDRLFRANVTGDSAESVVAGFSTLVGHDQSRFAGSSGS